MLPPIWFLTKIIYCRVKVNILYLFLSLCNILYIILQYIRYSNKHIKLKPPPPPPSPRQVLSASPHLVEEIQHVYIVRDVSKVLVEYLVDACFHQNGVIEGTWPKVVIEVPGWLPAAQLAPVNDVVGHQEETLQLWVEGADKKRNNRAMHQMKYITDVRKLLSYYAKEQ